MVKNASPWGEGGRTLAMTSFLYLIQISQLFQVTGLKILGDLPKHEYEKFGRPSHFKLSWLLRSLGRRLEMLVFSSPHVLLEVKYTSALN